MRVRVGHISLQFSDTDRQQNRDFERIFDRAVDRRLAWITGTEAGPGAGGTGSDLVRIAREHGYRPWVPKVQGDGIAENTDCWIAVREDLIKGKLERGFDLAFPSSRHFKDEIDLDGKKWGPKGVVHVSFDTTFPGLGRISVGAAHYLTEGRNPNSPYWDLNKKLAGTVGDWARKEGRGTALVFYGGDQNMADNRNDAPQGDTFFGERLTSTWDELEKWENTGHGVIDVIASYNRDGRVEAMATEAFNDREFHLHIDHFYVEAIFRVRSLLRR